MHIKNKRGQSTVEYILLVTAVIGVMIVFTTNKDTGVQQQLNSTLAETLTQIDKQSEVLANSHALSPANAVAADVPYTVKVTP